MVLVVKNPSVNAGDIRDAGRTLWSGRCPGRGHGNSLWYSCWRISRTEEPGGLQSIESQTVRHEWSNLAHMHILDNLEEIDKFLEPDNFISPTRRDKKAFLNDHCKKIEETRDLLKKIRDTKGTFHAKMGTAKDKLYGPKRSRSY